MTVFLLFCKKRIIYFNSLTPVGGCKHHIISYFQQETGRSEYVLFVSWGLSELLTGTAFEVTVSVCLHLVELHLCWAEKRRLKFVLKVRVLITSTKSV